MIMFILTQKKKIGQIFTENLAVHFVSILWEKYTDYSHKKQIFC